VTPIVTIILAILSALVGGLLVYILMAAKISEYRRKYEVMIAQNNHSGSEAELQNQVLKVAEAVITKSTEALSKTQSQNIEGIVKPLQQQLAEFKSTVIDYRSQDARHHGELSQYLQQLRDLNQQVSQDAKGLTQALKGENKTAGTWGEVVLERVLEASGLESGREYETQKTVSSPEGRMLRPDVIIYLPQDRQVVVDSKVSLRAYERGFNASDENERTQAYREHAASLKNHIRDLSGKEYHRAKELNSPDQILLFVPMEAALTVALQEDPGLYEYAWERGIMVVNPSTLYLALRLFKQMWTGAKQSENAQAIAKKAGLMLDKFTDMVTEIQIVKRKIGDAHQSIDTVEKRLATGKGNLINKAKELSHMGVTPQKSLPQVAMDESEEFTLNG
jgi:DNA recombination protein RmuC